MRSKQEFRAYFAECKKYVKISVLAKEIGISQSNLSYFMKDSAYDALISLEKLISLENHIQNTLEKIV